MDQHLDEKDLEGYVELLLQERAGTSGMMVSSIPAIEEHLDGCGLCSQKVDQMYRECLVFFDWSFDRDNQRIMIQKAVFAIQQVSKESYALVLQDRLARWEKAIFDAPKNLSRVLLDLSDQIRQNVSRFICPWGSQLSPSAWEFRYDTQWVPTRNGEKREEPNLQRLHARHVSGPYGFQALIDEDDHVISLEFDTGVPAERIPIVMLINLDDPERLPLLGCLEFQQEKDLYQIQFSNLPSGRYILMVEP